MTSLNKHEISPPSKNNLFFGSNSPTPAKFDSPALEPPRSWQATSRSHQIPSPATSSPYGRSSTAEQERERARIRSSKEIDFRLAPGKEFLLGEGRHSNVFLGAYRRKGVADDSVEEVDWHLCAVKRLHADRQSQLLGLDEAFALRRIGSHPGIVHLIDIRDEVLATTSPLPTPGVDTSLSKSSLPGMSRPAAILNPSLHGRSTSTCVPSGTKAERAVLVPREIVNRSQHSRLASQPTEAVLRSLPNVSLDPSEATSLELPSSAAALQVQNSGREPENNESIAGLETSTSDPPRLLILLELLPYNLGKYARRHPENVDVAFWFRCAVELASTLEFIHSRGCVHSDIKPENILLDSSLRTKLCDFNSAIFPNATSTPLVDGLGLGTPAYGAPELTKRGAGSKVSYPVDVFSLGAVLYGLATGVEPMARARSAVDMLHRKERFFLTEENDRLARVSLGEGYGSSSNAGSTNASRHSSMKARKSKQRQSLDDVNVQQSPSQRPPLFRKESTESLESVASSITTMGGRTPSLAAVRFLLEPCESAGLFLPLEYPLRGTSTESKRDRLANVFDGKGHHHRAASLHKKTPSRQNGRVSGQCGPELQSDVSDGGLERPWVGLRRTTSYGGQQQEDAEHPEVQVETRQPTRAEQTSIPSSPSSLSLAVVATFADVSRKESRNNASYEGLQQRALHQRHTRKISTESGGYTALSEDEDEDFVNVDDDRTPYRDGSPALLLPGGGRLPQRAFDLLSDMLTAEPSKRPSAASVKSRLLQIKQDLQDD